MKIRTDGGILKSGQRFANYNVVRLIAVGGMSEVYEAMHVGLRKRVALKVMRPDLAANPEARRGFVAEGVNASRIRHTNVVDVTDVGVFEELPYLVMSLLEGEDLAALYDRRGRIPPAELVDLLMPVAFAVAIGHSQGVVHRDLKPDNVFLHREGCRVIPKVLDFGVSRLVGALRTTNRLSVFGTPHYMAPEQARGEPSDTRADQYSLAVMLYQGLTGRLPRESVDASELLQMVAFGASSYFPPSRHVTLPPELEAAICRAMSYEPAQRFDSMRDLAFELLPFASPEARRYWSEELNIMPNIGPNGRAVSTRPQAPGTAKSPTMPVPAEPTASELGKSWLLDAGWNRPRVVPPSAAQTLPPTATRERPSGWPDAEVPEASFAKRHRKSLGLSAAGAALLAVAGWLAGSSSSEGTTVISPASLPAVPERAARYLDIDVQVTPASARLLLDERPVAIGHYKAHILQDGASHELRAVAPGFVTRSIWFRDEAPGRTIELARIPPAPIASAAPPAPALPMTHNSAAKPAPLRKPQRPTAPPVHPRAVPAASPPEPAAESGVALQLPQIGVVEPQQAKVRIVDAEQPRVRVIE